MVINKESHRRHPWCLPMKSGLMCALERGEPQCKECGYAQQPPDVSGSL